MKPLTQRESDILLALLLRLYESTIDQDIKRVAKSLFSLQSRQRFSMIDDQ